MNAIAIAITVDARGQSCPGPLVALHKALRDAAPGDVLELLATDPGSRSDVPSWAKLSGTSSSRPVRTPASSAT